MQTINLQVEESFFPHFKVLIESFIKDNKVKVITPETPKNEIYKKNKKILNESLEAYRNEKENFSALNKNYWNDVQSRLLARHKKA